MAERMRKVFKYLIAAVLASGFSCGCSHEITVTDHEEDNLIVVPLHLAAEEYECDEATKGTSPYIPDVENLIGDIWVVQYSSRGVLLPSSTFHYRKNDPGDMVVGDLYYAAATSGGVALVESAEACTVCFIANMGDNVPSEWPDNIYSFQEIMLPVLDADASVHPDRLPMCGYYQGPVTHGTKVSASLGRLVTRINIVINNMTGENISDLNVSLTNAPRYAHLYPASTTTPLNEKETEAPRIPKDIGLSLAAGGSLNLYYYIAPNLYAENWPTTLWTTCHLDGTNQDAKGAMILGDTAPTDADQEVYPPVIDPERNLKLYSNNQYTFTINYVNNK